MIEIPLARPTIGDEEIAAAERVLRSGRLSGGPEIARFETRVAEVCDRNHAVAVSSGTTALEIAFRALDVACGDRVLVTAFGFPAAANALKRMGIDAVPVDVERSTWLTDFECAYALADGCVGLVAIDQLGLSTSSVELKNFADKTGLWVISDAACSFGASDEHGRKGGSQGVMGTLSFHPRKPITTGEGGAIVTDDQELSARLLSLRNHGQRASGQFSEFSTNARMSSILAAIGSVQIERLEVSLAERQLIAAGYCERLAGLEQRGRLTIQTVPVGALSAYQSFALCLAGDVDRGSVILKLRELGIEAGPSTYAFSEIALHQSFGLAPNAKTLHHQSLSLPMYNGIRSTELDTVVQGLENVLA